MLTKPACWRDRLTMLPWECKPVQLTGLFREGEPVDRGAIANPFDQWNTWDGPVDHASIGGEPVDTPPPSRDLLNRQSIEAPVNFRHWY